MFGSQLYDGGLFQEFRRLERDLDEQFGHWLWPLGIRSTGRGAWPPMNVGLTPDHVEIYLFAAGLDPKSVDISVEQSLVTVSGERKVPERGEVTWYRNERFNGSFRRAISLPEDIDPDSIQARYRDGVLQITAKRPEAAKPRQIQIN